LTLQTRIVLAVVGPLCVLLALEIGVVSWQVRSWRLQDLDRALAARAMAVSQLVEFDGGWEVEAPAPGLVADLTGWQVSAGDSVLISGGRLDGRTWRGELPIETEGGPARAVDVAVAMDPSPVLAELRGLLVRLVAVGLALMALGTWAGVVLSRRIVSGRRFRELQRAWERQAAFTADAAHELRTPLATLRNEAEVTLRRPRDEATYRRALQTVGAAALRMQRILDGLLTLARGGEEPAWARVDLADLARQAAERHRDNSPVPIEVDAPAQAVARADPRLVEIALDNLLSNAIRHTSSGRIRLVLAPDDRGWTLSVEDSGEGIAVEHLSHVFERFYRVDAGRGRDRGGSGIGLAIVDDIARRHGGTVDISSRPGEGTTVRVHLPGRGQLSGL